MFSFEALYSERTQTALPRVFLTMPATRKPFSNEVKRAAVELWRANVPLKKIREQLNMNERTLRRILSHAKANPDVPVALRKLGSGRTAKVKKIFQDKIKKKV